MNQFHGSRMPLVQVDPGNARIIDLLEKLSQVGPSFMINKGILDQRWC